VTLPPGLLLQGDAIACGGEDLPAADGHQLAALVLTRHVVEHRCVVDERVQLPGPGRRRRDRERDRERDIRGTCEERRGM